MCGACARERTTWADAVLSRAYARMVVARIAGDLATRKIVRAGPAGWTVTGPSGGQRVCRSVSQLVQALEPDLDRAFRVLGAAELERRILRVGRHRPLGTDDDGGGRADALIPRLFHEAATKQMSDSQRRWSNE